jgi:hypothetical protein
MPSRSVHVDVCEPVRIEGEDCPDCGFESLTALIILINGNPRIRVFCGRCRARERNA